VLIGALLSMSGPAHAHNLELQEQVDVILKQNPGSKQTGPNEVTMVGGDPVLTLDVDEDLLSFAAKAVGSCPSGKFCAYSSIGYNGSVLTYSTCTSNHSVAGLSAVRSIANSRASGTVRAYKGSTLLATVAAGTGKDVSAGSTKLTCS
jgi:hypothetical protein